MRHISRFMDKYEDIAETLNGVFVMLMTGAVILGIAPLIIFLQSTHFQVSIENHAGEGNFPQFLHFIVRKSVYILHFLCYNIHIIGVKVQITL